MEYVKRRSAKFVWNVGHVAVVAVFLGIPFLCVVILKLLKLYEIDYGFNLDQFLGANLAVFILLIYWGLVVVSDRWEKWALKVTEPEQLDDLQLKISDKKQSIRFRGWSKLSSLDKKLRIVFVVVIVAGALVFDDYKAALNSAFEKEGVYTQAKVLSIQKKVKRKKPVRVLEYSYRVDDVEYIDDMEISYSWAMLPEEKNGFIVQVGDQFELSFLKSNPQENRLDLLKPLLDTELRYVEDTKAFLTENTTDSARVNCIVNAVYEQFGLKGLAKLYNKDVSWWRNENYNQIKYVIFTNSEEYKSLESRCLDIISK